MKGCAKLCYLFFLECIAVFWPLGDARESKSESSGVRLGLATNSLQLSRESDALRPIKGKEHFEKFSDIYWILGREYFVSLLC